MIVFRYLLREVLSTTFAVSSVLLLIIMSGRFVKYLAQAAAGRISADVLLQIMVYRIPGFLELVLPLGFFIALLLAYGRLYMDSEMTVLNACGFSTRRLVGYTALIAFVIAIIVAVLSLWVSPLGTQASSAIIDQQRQRTEFESLKPRQFQSVQGGATMTYAEGISSDKKRMERVFMAEMASDSQGGDLSVLRADSGKTVFREDYQQRYLQLDKGARYDGRPGDPGYRITDFDELYVHLPAPENVGRRTSEVDNRTTAELLAADDLPSIAGLQWRLSLPILVMLVALMAVPLSRTNPRAGRYAKMLPAIILYIIYLITLNAARGALEEGSVPPALGIWWVHGVFAVIAAVLLKASSMAGKPRNTKPPENLLPVGGGA